jgi:capsular exopolysaccharide synthesis family protein
MNTQDPTSRVLTDRIRRPSAGQNSPEDTIDLGDLFRAIWRGKWIVLGAALALASLVAVAVSQVTPLYTAVSKVMLDPRERRVVNSEEVVSSLDLSNPVIASEVAMIRSSVLLQSVIRQIGLPNLAEYDPSVPAEPGITDRIVAALSSAMGLSTDAPVAVEKTDATANAELAGDTLERRVVQRMRQSLEVEQEGDSYVIAISFHAESPVLAATIVNTIAERYIDRQLEARVDVTRRANEWLEKRVEDLRTQVAAAEEVVEAYRAAKVSADGGGLNTANQQLAAMSGQLAAARADKAGIQARADQIRALEAAEGIAAAAEVLQSPYATALLGDRSTLLRESAELATRYGETHPMRLRVEAEIAQIEAELADEVVKIIEVLEKEVEVASIREAAIASDLLRLEERVSQISGSSIELRHLEREADALRDVYTNFLSRFKETRAQEALAQAEASVIEYAMPPGAPSYPRNKLLIAAGIVAGGGLGLALVLIRELTSNTFRSTQHLERETGLKVLSAIPRMRRKRSVAEAFQSLVQAPYSNYGESIRQLRTALMFGGGEPPRSIAVTSSFHGEGRSSVTLSLAYMNKLMGRNVIIVDCDFRRAALSKAFGWTPKNDLSSVLRSEADLRQAIVSDKQLGFDVLPVSQPVADIADMLSPDRFRAMIDTLQDSYDLVLIDSPPILTASDARVIARSADVLVYLIRARSTSISATRQGLALLYELGIEPLGLVSTMVDRRQMGDTQRGIYPSARMTERQA